MAKKQGVQKKAQELSNKELAAALEAALKTLSPDRQVPEPIWREMRKHQLLGRRSLNANVRVSGPIEE